MKKILSYTIILAFLIGCGYNDSPTMKALEQADTLMKASKYEEAYPILKNCMHEKHMDDDEKALFGILAEWGEPAFGKKMASDTIIDFSISHYEKNGNQARLAYAYYFKGVKFTDYGDMENALLFFKKAEYNNNLNKDKWLTQHLYVNIAYVNTVAGAYKKALYYAKKALENAKNYNDVEWQCRALDAVAQCFYYMEDKDSAEYYMSQITPLIGKLKYKESKAMYLNNIGVLLYDRGKSKKAEPYLRYAVKILPEPPVMLTLAKICGALGKEDESDSLLSQAWKRAKFEVKTDILEFMAEKSEKENDFKQAAQLRKRAKAMADSAAKEKKTEEMLSLQDKYDQSTSEKDASDRFSMLGLTAVAAIITTCLSAYFISRKRINRVRRAMKKSNEQIEELQSLLEEAEKGKTRNEEEIAKLKKRIKEQKAKQAVTLKHGASLFGEVCNGGNTSKWEKDDYETVIEHIRSEHPELVEAVETGHTRLTPYNTFFLLLEGMGKSQDEIARIMNMTQGAVRTMRHRLNAKAKA